MTETLTPIPSGVRSFEVRCKIGQFVVDGPDNDRAPDLAALGGTVSIAPDLRKPIRINGDDPLDTRVVGFNTVEFQIDPATGQLIHPDGRPGVELVDPSDPHLDPQDWTYTALVKPAVGKQWSVTFGTPPDGAQVVNIGGLAGVDISPGVGANPVQQAVAARDETLALVATAEDAAERAGTSAEYAATVAYDQPLEVTDATTALMVGDVSTATRGALDRAFRTAVNVMDFGAVGNSRDDDTAAIQAAEAAAASGRGAALFFPPGTYRFSHTITATTILGHNRQKTILHYTGTGDAVGNGGGLKYHRKFEGFTLRGEGVGVGLNLDTSPAGVYRNMIVQDFETGIYLDGGSTLYNVFDDVTVQSTVTGVKIDGLAHESRFKNFRINYAQIGIDVMGAGRTVIDSSSVENCSQYGVVIRDRGPGRNVATTLFSTRFEFNPVNIRIEPNVTKTAIIACHPVGGITEDLGIDTTQINTNGDMSSTGTMTTGTFKGENVDVVALKGDRAQARTSFNDARIQLIESGTVIDRNRDGSGTALRVNQVHDASTGSVLDVQRRSETVARVTNSGHLSIRAATAPAVASIATGEAQFWVDTTNGAARLMVAAKQADGKVVSGSIPLAVTP